MNTDLFIRGATNIGIAAYCIIFSVAMFKGRIKYPWGIPKASVSEDNWMAINRYGAKAHIMWSLPILIIGTATLVAAFIVPPTQSIDIAWKMPISLSALLLLGAMVQTRLWSRHLPDRAIQN